MGIPLGHRRDVFDRNINWPYVDWNLLSKFPFRHVLVSLCITFRRHSLFMYQLCLLRRRWHLIMHLLGTSWRRLWHLIRHMLDRRRGRMWHLRNVGSRDGENISPASTTRSKFGRGGGGEEAVNIMSRLCQRMNCPITSPSNTSPSGVA